MAHFLFWLWMSVVVIFWVFVVVNAIWYFINLWRIHNG